MSVVRRVCFRELKNCDIHDALSQLGGMEPWEESPRSRTAFKHLPNYKHMTLMGPFTCLMIRVRVNIGIEKHGTGRHLLGLQVLPPMFTGVFTQGIPQIKPSHPTIRHNG